MEAFGSRGECWEWLWKEPSFVPTLSWCWAFHEHVGSCKTKLEKNVQRIMTSEVKLRLFQCCDCIHATQSSCKGLMVSSPQHFPKRKWEKAFSLSFFPFFVACCTVTHRCSYSKTNTHTHRHTHAQMLMFTHTPIYKSKHTVTADNTQKLH